MAKVTSESAFEDPIEAHLLANRWLHPATTVRSGSILGAASAAVPIPGMTMCVSSDPLPV